MADLNMKNKDTLEEYLRSQKTSAYKEKVDEYTNTDLKPMSTTDHPWLYAFDPKIYDVVEEECGGIIDDPGKWMTFFKKGEVDDKWAEAQRLYKYV
jgi:hypothetical protein